MIQTLRKLFTSPKYNTLWRIATIALVIGLSIYIYNIRNDARKLVYFGYPGVFLLAFLSYATVILPAPGLAIIFTMSGLLSHPLPVAIAAGLGATLGETTGYIAGMSGRIIAEDKEIYVKLTQWMEKNGPLTILILATIPNPFFDLAGIAAGALKMPIKKFMFWCWVGQTIKMLTIAFAGSGLLSKFL
ncbi:MAG: VTT domain-containing protein [Anaerolineales bacterium]